jgi:type IV pilus assembly protein PilE
MEADEKGFKASATAVVDFDRDGTYDIWEIDQDKNLRQIVKD